MRALPLLSLFALLGFGVGCSGGSGGPEKDASADASETSETGPSPRPEIFPEEPIVEGGAPDAARTLFESEPVDTTLAAAPCVIAPEEGTIYPRNWLRPRVEFTPVGDHDLFEIVFRVEGLERPLRIYTRAPETTLSAALWSSLSRNYVDEPIELTVRSARTTDGGATLDQLSEAAVIYFVVAPVAAPGEVVYWALPDGYGGAGVLKGFQIGDEGVVTVLAAGDVDSPPPSPVLGNGDAPCVGCHTATPDGAFVGLSTGPVTGYAADTYYRNTLAGVSSDNLGQLPAWIDASALDELKARRGLIAFSKAHWSGTDRIALLSHDGAALHALNLAAPIGAENPKVVARDGDADEVTCPTWSHDGQTIVYTSIDGTVVDGRPATGAMDLFAVPYADGAGGEAAPVAGASEPDYIEYYPAFSPDDRFIAFTRAPSGTNAYDQALAEIFIVPRAGGEAVRLAANDPAACSASSSPGVHNSWPKWSPEVRSANGKFYYFLTFSSKRRGVHQLFVTTVVLEGETVVTSPALHLWNQPADEGNHTPAWEYIAIPITGPL